MSAAAPPGGGRTRDAHETEVLALASEASRVVAAEPGADELLPHVAARVREALDVAECAVYEYRPETREVVGAAVWPPGASLDGPGWVDTVYPLADRPALQRVIGDRVAVVCHADDPGLGEGDRRVMDRWGERSMLAVPLVFQDEVIGALVCVETRAVRVFTDEDVRLLELMAVPAALALETVLTGRRDAERTRRLGALLAASRIMMSTIDLDELLTAITRVAREALDTAECAIDTYDPETERLTVVAFVQREPEPGWEEWIGSGFSLVDYPSDRRILFDGRIVEERVSDPGTDARSRADMEQNGEASILNVPLVHEGRPIGLLVFIETGYERHFDDEERLLAAALGEQAASAIHHAQLMRESEARNRQLRLLLESMQAISSSVDLDDVLNTVARTAADVFGSDECQIQEYDASANTVKPVALWQRVPDEVSPQSLGKTFSLDEEPEEMAFLRAQTVLEQRYSDPELRSSTRAAFERFGDRAYLNVPLVFSGSPVGVLVLVEKQEERHWTDDEVALALGLAEQAAVAIEHARLYRRVQDQALTDGLTGLFNHRYFYDRLDQELRRGRRYGTPVSLLMIDLDDFKAFNDRHGHLAGDAVLRTTADALRSELRQHLDIAARYGGEEFAVILPNTGITAA